ncbi:peptidoglycan DD-metalloendopeptidase family protein [Aquimarina sp. ERC-38]|uniref:murein hydrolase activator EnvC family protein n=1 Tax=Aquimarina sp. ERC-38 TaxID=2949996 RepID=UPI002246A733|nr:peptidoglycan DD-metalloendopeptidase family protein [Aquimarina sp. ERC-38]UZO81658.1 peptidoglycan DD-metalloendopeptidase family protein [Aquimarina sp. ERC-38]
MSISKLFAVCIICCLSFNAFSQKTKQEQLEEKRKQLRQEIASMMQLQESNKAKEKSVLDEVETLSSQIQTRQNLIKVTNQQANLLSREINANLNKIQDYRKELKVLKEEYAKMVVQARRSKSQQSKIMFLLSSADFAQAYRRLQYLKQYNEYRREQGEQIQNKATDLQQLNLDLAKKKENKEKLVQENKEVQAKLASQKKQQVALMATIRSKESVYKKQIRQKQKEADAVDRQIEKLIREAIARANKKKKTSKTATTGTATTFSLTPEDKKLADSFTANKGKLPWPVGAGRITKKFGRQPHPTLPNIEINSSGVELETKPGEKARAIFAGEVMDIKKLKGASRLVIVKHGNYITTYYNLENIAVTEGQKLETKEVIGNVRTNPATGRAIMKFLIYQNTKKLNPQQWIYRM